MTIFLDKDQDWTDEASILFENLTHVAKWKVIMAKYMGVQSTNFGPFKSLILYDTNGEEVSYWQM